MKKSFIVPMMLAGILGVGAAAGINFGKDPAAVHAAVGDAVSGWKANGTGTALEGEDGIDISLSGYQSNMTKSDSKVYLDGLQFTMKNIGTAGGFYFSQDVDKTGWDGPVFTFWNGSSSTAWATQARLFIQPDHDFNQASKTMAYKNIEDEEPSGLNDAQKSMVWSASETLTMTFKFELFEKDWFKITVSYPDASTVVNPNNMSGKSFHTFVKREAFSLDEDGAAYLKIHTAGSFSCTLKDFKNGNAIGWKTNGNGSVVKNSDGLNISLSGYQSNVTKADAKVNLDGLEFTMKNIGTAGGFFFSQDVSKVAYDGPIFTYWNGSSSTAWPTQARLFIQPDHDFNASSSTMAYKSIEDQDPSGLNGDTKSMVWSASETLTMSFKFELYEEDWFKVTVSYPDATTVVGPYNASGKSFYTFVKREAFSLDDSGAAYLKFYSVGDFSCILDGFKDGTPIGGETPEGIEEEIKAAAKYVKDKFNALDEDDYKAVAYATISEAKVTALAAIEAAKVVEDLETATAAFDKALEDNPKMECVVSEDWSVTNGSTEQLGIYETEDNIRIKNLHAYSAEVVKNEKVVLDGFEMTFGSTGLSRSSGLGFFFNQSSSSGRDGSFAVFSLWNALYSGQSRFHIGTSHDYNGASIAHASNSADSAIGFGVASNMVMNEKFHDLIHIKFTHVSTLWWKIELSEVVPETIWGNNVNYDEGTVTVYVQSSYLPIDENGAAYLHVEGFSNAGGAAIIKNMVNGELKPITEDPATDGEIAAAKAALDAIAPEFPEECGDAIGEIVATAKSACDAEGVKPSELETAVTNAKKAAIAAYRSWRGLDQEITEQDSTANYENYAGENLGKRLDDNGSVLMRMKTGYGGRGRLISKYSLTDFEMRLELIDCPVNSAVPVTFSNSAGNYASEDNYFHLEFYKLAADKYQVIFGNTKGHNLSIDAWTTSNVNTYTGRTMFTLSNIFDISMSTDFETLKSTLKINGEELEFDTRLIFDETGSGAGTDAMVEEGTMARITIGTMNNDGTYYNAACSISDDSYASYVEGRADVVESALDSLGDLEDSIPETVTDANYAAFKETLASINGITSVEGLASYDFNKYVAGDVATVKAAAEAKLAAYAETVENAKDLVYDMLDSYVEDDYYETEWASIEEIIEGVDARLEGLETVGAVEAEGAAIKAELDAVKTKAVIDAEAALAQAKVDAVAALAQHADLDHIEDTNELRDVAALVSSGNTAINAAASIEDVASELASAKGAIDAKKAEYATQRALVAKQTELLGLIDELENSIDASKYTSENAALIQSYIDTARGTIEKATSISGLQEVYDKLVSDVNAVEKKPAEPVNPDEPAKKGCGGSVIAASALVTGLAIAGAALVSKKRKEN